MKQYIAFILLMFTVACNEPVKQSENSKLLPTSLVANPATADGADVSKLNAMPVLVFKDTLHDFGTLQAGEIGSYDFEFTNTGKSPLLISDAKASCGCTVADYPREPIQPGTSAKMKVTYNSTGKSGHQEKSINIITNARRAITNIYIKAEVNGSKNASELPTQ